MLFAHIARASCYPQLAPIVKTYPHLMKYFYDICDIYFGQSVASFADFTTATIRPSLTQQITKMRMQ